MFYVRVRKPGSERWALWKGGPGLQTTRLPELAVDFDWASAQRYAMTLRHANPGVEIEAREHVGPRRARSLGCTGCAECDPSRFPTFEGALDARDSATRV